MNQRRKATPPEKVTCDLRIPPPAMNGASHLYAGIPGDVDSNDHVWLDPAQDQLESISSHQAACERTCSGKVFDSSRNLIGEVSGAYKVEGKRVHVGTLSRVR